MEKSVSDHTKEEEKGNETPSENDEPTFFNSKDPKPTVEELLKEFILNEKDHEEDHEDYKKAKSEIIELFKAADKNTEKRDLSVDICECTPKYIVVNCKFAYNILHLIRHFVCTNNSSSKNVRNSSDMNSTNDTDTDSDITCRRRNRSNSYSNISSSNNNSFPNKKIDEPARGMSAEEYQEYTKSRVNRHADL